MRPQIPASSNSIYFIQEQFCESVFIFLTFSIAIFVFYCFMHFILHSFYKVIVLAVCHRILSTYCKMCASDTLIKDYLLTYLHCRQILTAETIKIWKFRTSHLPILDQYVSRWGLSDILVLNPQPMPGPVIVFSQSCGIWRVFQFVAAQDIFIWGTIAQGIWETAGSPPMGSREFMHVQRRHAEFLFVRITIV